MSEEWTPKIPKYGPVYCLICGEKVTAPPFIASKPRGGPVVYIHTDCFTKEQRELRKEKART